MPFSNPDVQEGVYISPTISSAYNNIGTCYMKMGNLQLAEKEFRIAVDLGKNRLAIFLFNLAAVYNLEANYEKAAECYLAVIKQYPNDPKAHYYLALTYLDLHQESDYLREMKETLKTNPDWVAIRMELASFLASKGKCPEAIELIDSAPLTEPAFAKIRDMCP